MGMGGGANHSDAACQQAGQNCRSSGGGAGKSYGVMWRLSGRDERRMGEVIDDNYMVNDGDEQ